MIRCHWPRSNVFGDANREEQHYASRTHECDRRSECDELFCQSSGCGERCICWLVPRKPGALGYLSCWSNGTSEKFSMAQRITRNREDAEDVVQQSCQKAFI